MVGRAVFVELAKRGVAFMQETFSGAYCRNGGGVSCKIRGGVKKGRGALSGIRFSK